MLIQLYRIAKDKDTSISAVFAAYVRAARDPSWSWEQWGNNWLSDHVSGEIGGGVLERLFPALGPALTIQTAGNLIATGGHLGVDTIFLWQISSKRACYGYKLDDGKLSRPRLVKNPAFLTESHMRDSIYKVWERTDDRTWPRPDVFQARYLNLSCDQAGLARVGQPRETSLIFLNPKSRVVRAP